MACTKILYLQVVSGNHLCSPSGENQKLNKKTSFYDIYMSFLTKNISLELSPFRTPFSLKIKAMSRKIYGFACKIIKFIETLCLSLRLSDPNDLYIHVLDHL